MTEQGCELATRLIKRKAKQLVGHYGLRQQDREDIEQDLWVDVAGSDGKADPCRREFSYLAKVVDNAAASLVRRRRRLCRDYRRECTIEETLDRSHHDLRTRRSAAPPSDLEIDLREAIAQLPDIPKWVVRRLRDHSMTENAQSLSMSRAKLYELLGHARLLLRKLEVYLQLPDTSDKRGVVTPVESL